MPPSVHPSDELFQVSLRQAQVRHAIKTALACALSAAVTYYFRFRSEQLAPVFAFLLFTMGMPAPRMNWLLTQLAVIASSLVSALILVCFHDTLFLYLSLSLFWTFVCLSLGGWLPMPATLGGMVTAISIFTFLEGGLGAALNFFVDYTTNFIAGGLSVVVVHTFVWPLNTPKVFVSRLAQVYDRLEAACSAGSTWLRTGSAPAFAEPFGDWAPFRPLRQLVAPELFHGRDTTSPFAGLILACRSLNLRLWFFNRAFGRMEEASLPAEARARLADRLDRFAAQFAALVTGALDRRPVPPADPQTLAGFDSLTTPSGAADPLVAHNIQASILQYVGRDLAAITQFHNALFARFRGNFQSELVSLWPGPNSAGLFDVQSMRAGVKLVLILILLLFAEGWLGLPGESQVAFYATFFASSVNLGRQTRTDLIDVVGLLSGFAYGVVAAFITSRLPHFPLLLALVFLGQFLADLAYQRLPRYSVAGLQAGLALPFTFLATVGPEWGSFTTVRTRLAGLLLAGCTAVIVHAVVWPEYPMRQLRRAIAGALRSTAASLVALFRPPHTAWTGAPPDLRQTILRARDLLDDARFLPGPQNAEDEYRAVLVSLQEIDASLEYTHLLTGLPEERSCQPQFYALMNDYPAEAQAKLPQIARQFDDPPSRDGPIEWHADTSRRWNEWLTQSSLQASVIERQRPVVIGRCLDQIAAACTQISQLAAAINARSQGPSRRSVLPENPAEN
ncbi:MAG: hypothetical protein AB7G28_06680 [Pirellulales bacterium]